MNKSDGELISAAIRTQSEYLSSLKYIKQRTQQWKIPVKRVSSLTKEGIEDLWSTISSFHHFTLESGQFMSRRKEQQRAWLHTHLQEAIMKAFTGTQGLDRVLLEAEKSVMNGVTSPGAACDQVMQKYREILKQ